MMTDVVKKEIFIQILENWFDDYSEDVSKENCIGFYNHLIYSLEFEYTFPVDLNINRDVFFKKVLEVLYQFDKIIENGDMSAQSIISIDFLKNLSQELSVDFKTVLFELKTIYNTAKQEYLYR